MLLLDKGSPNFLFVQSETYRDVCFVHTHLKRNASAARDYCASFGTTLAKPLSADEQDRLVDVM